MSILKQELLFILICLHMKELVMIVQDLLDIKNAQKNQNSMASLKALEIINRMLGFNEASKIQVQSLNLELKFPDLDVPKLLTDKEIENYFKDEISDSEE